jgi:hypothetical protein
VAKSWRLRVVVAPYHHNKYYYSGFVFVVVVELVVGLVLAVKAVVDGLVAASGDIEQVEVLQRLREQKRVDSKAVGH